MKGALKKKIVVIFVVTATLSFALFLLENVFAKPEAVIKRNTYGGGEKVAEYEVAVEGEAKETMQIEVGEQEYSSKEIQKIFREVIDKLYFHKELSFYDICEECGLERSSIYRHRTNALYKIATAIYGADVAVR